MTSIKSVGVRSIRAYVIDWLSKNQAFLHVSQIHLSSIFYRMGGQSFSLYVLNS